MRINIKHEIGTHLVDFTDIPFKSGNLIFVHKHQVNTFNFSSPSQESIILFTDSKADSFAIMLLFSALFLMIEKERSSSQRLTLSYRETMMFVNFMVQLKC